VKCLEGSAEGRRLDLLGRGHGSDLYLRTPIALRGCRCKISGYVADCLGNRGKSFRIRTGQSERSFTKVTFPLDMKRHHNVTMQDRVKFLTTAVCSVAVSAALASWGQAAGGDPATRLPVESRNPHTYRYRTLSKNDRSSVVTVALHSKKTRIGGHDCSHLVHSIYQNAGFPYEYADSEDLYDGVKGFQRVAHPEAADLVVWRGHVGIVIRPQRHQFFSLLSSGPGIDDYRSRYWKSRGQVRFYRYVKTDS
jgi:hypothetical protein